MLPCLPAVRSVANCPYICSQWCPFHGNKQYLNKLATCRKCREFWLLSVRSASARFASPHFTSRQLAKQCSSRYIFIIKASVQPVNNTGFATVLPLLFYAVSLVVGWNTYQSFGFIVVLAGLSHAVLKPWPFGSCFS